MVSIQKLKFNNLNSDQKNDLKEKFREIFKNPNTGKPCSEQTFYDVLGKHNLENINHARFFAKYLSIDENVFVKPELILSGKPSFKTDLVKP